MGEIESWDSFLLLLWENVWCWSVKVDVLLDDCLLLE